MWARERTAPSTHPLPAIAPPADTYPRTEQGGFVLAIKCAVLSGGGQRYSLRGVEKTDCAGATEIPNPVDPLTSTQCQPGGNRTQSRQLVRLGFSQRRVGATGCNGFRSHGKARASVTDSESASAGPAEVCRACSPGGHPLVLEGANCAMRTIEIHAAAEELLRRPLLRSSVRGISRRPHPRMRSTLHATTTRRLSADN
jgi:hypothetical protein